MLTGLTYGGRWIYFGVLLTFSCIAGGLAYGCYLLSLWCLVTFIMVVTYFYYGARFTSGGGFLFGEDTAVYFVVSAIALPKRVMHIFIAITHEGILVFVPLNFF